MSLPFTRTERHSNVPMRGPLTAIQTIARKRLSLTPTQRRCNERILMTVSTLALLVYMYPVVNTMITGPSFDTAANTLAPRTVLKGQACLKQRHQINVFMASFFGGVFAADQWYARNFQLAIPKFLVLCIGFGARTMDLIESLTSVSPFFAWWLIDVVFWGVGYYTTGTNGNHWGNPTQQCAVVGW